MGNKTSLQTRILETLLMIANTLMIPCSISAGVIIISMYVLDLL